MTKAFKYFERFRRTPRITVTPPKGRSIVIPFKAASLVLILILLTLSSFLALRSDLFLIRNFKIKISGSDLSRGFVDSSLVRESLQKFVARSVLFVNPKEVKEIVRLVSLVIKDTAVTRIFPDTLAIDVLLREPVAQVLSGESRFLVDESGFIFAKAPSNVFFPQFGLAGDQKVDIGQSLETVFVQSAIKIIIELRGKDLFKIKSFDLQKDGIVVVLSEDGLIVYFKSGSEVLAQVKDLQAILKKAKTEKGRLVKVDFRFERPIVVFQ